VIAAEVDFRIPLGWETLHPQPFRKQAHAIVSTMSTQLGAGGALVRSEVVRLVEVAEMNLFWKRTWTLQDLYDHVGLSAKLQAVLAGQSGDYALPPQEIAADPYFSCLGLLGRCLSPSITSSTSLTRL